MSNTLTYQIATVKEKIIKAVALEVTGKATLTAADCNDFNICIYQGLERIQYRDKQVGHFIEEIEHTEDGSIKIHIGFQPAENPEFDHLYTLQQDIDVLSDKKEIARLKGLLEEQSKRYYKLDYAITSVNKEAAVKHAQQSWETFKIYHKL